MSIFVRDKIGSYKYQDDTQDEILSVLIYILTMFGNGARRVQGNPRSGDRGNGTQTEARFLTMVKLYFYQELIILLSKLIKEARTNEMETHGKVKG